jgi:hypothetical protein
MGIFIIRDRNEQSEQSEKWDNSIKKRRLLETAVFVSLSPFDPYLISSQAPSTRLGYTSVWVLRMVCYDPQDVIRKMSILFKLGAALGLGLLGVGRLERN